MHLGSQTSWQRGGLVLAREFAARGGNILRLATASRAGGFTPQSHSRLGRKTEPCFRVAFRRLLRLPSTVAWSSCVGRKLPSGTPCFGRFRFGEKATPWPFRLATPCLVRFRFTPNTPQGSLGFATSAQMRTPRKAEPCGWVQDSRTGRKPSPVGEG